MAITKFDQFDFLIDIVPRDDLKPPKRQVGKWQTCKPQIVLDLPLSIIGNLEEL